MDDASTEVPAVPGGGSPGDRNGRNDLTAQVYQQLRRIAEVRVAAQRPGHTLQATALVHEAYLKLRNQPWVFAAPPGHFFRVAAEAMRQILVDHARSRGRQKRGGGSRRAAGDVADVADVAELASGRDADEIMALEEAVRRLERAEPRAAEVVKLRFFAGLSAEEAAEATGLSVRTVHREWKFARAWLYNALCDALEPP